MADKDSKSFINALKTGDRSLMDRIPKADVHSHAALGGDFNRWVKKEGLDLKEGTHSFPDFTVFQDLVDNIFTYPYGTPSSQQQISRFLSLYGATYENAIAHGVSYIEPGYDSPLLDHFNGDIKAMVRVLKEQMDSYSQQITIRPDIGIIRVFERKDIEHTIYPCIESGIFNALDIFADERHGPPEDFVDVFKAAKKAGMKLKAHAGELLDANYVRRSVELLDLDELQHGIAAAQSTEVMKFLVDRNIRLNICPSSNVQLCTTESYAAHPLRILMDNGVKCCINSDDAIIFGQSCSDEYFNLYQTGLYSAEELDQLRLNGFPQGR
ncbi:MAG: hypothetical protein PF447_10240 [Spirochaetaceae bacterium]|jgi:adenosine deaminase|nr:hypothetical protein [Spirochaetaceae bacterium]